MRIAVLDLGSISFKVLVADVSAGGLRKIHSGRRMVRLGAGTLSTGVIDARTFERAVTAAEELVAEALLHDPEGLVGVATSAMREAQNGRELCRVIEQTSGVGVEVLSGESEARLVHRGASASVARPDRPLLVLDLGGGSLEVVLGWHGEVQLAHSLPLGVLRVREALVPEGGFVSARTAHAIADRVDALTADVALELSRAEAFDVAVSGGTARALADLSMALSLAPRAVRVLDRAALTAMQPLLAGLRANQLIGLGVPAARTDTLATGAVILETLFRRLGVLRAPHAGRALRAGVALREWSRVAGHQPVAARRAYAPAGLSAIR